MTVRSVAVRDQVSQLESRISVEKLDESGLTRREALALRLARSLADNPFRLTEAQIAELRTEFDDDEIVEMIFACAIFSWGNIVGIATRVDTAADSSYGAGRTYAEGYARKILKTPGE